MNPSIAGAGIACLDHIVVAPRINWGDSTHISHYTMQGGGLVATAIAACARLGADTWMAGMVGGDPAGAMILAGLRDEGVDVEGIQVMPVATSPFSFIHVAQETGERTIFHHESKGLSWSGGDLSPIISRQVLLIDNYYPELAKEAAKLARAHGVPVVADTQPKPGNEDFLRMVDVLISPSHYVRDAGFNGNVDAALDAIHVAGPSIAVITLGDKGWAASDMNGRHMGGSFPVDVVDTLGAGDVFHGAFAYGMAHGWNTPRCAEFASAVAALKCTRIGGRAGIPSLPAALAFLRQNSKMDWSLLP